MDLRPASRWVAFFFALSLLSCGTNPYPEYEPQWAVEPARTDLAPFGAAAAELEFSQDSKYVCAWWWPGTKVGDYTKEPGRTVVFDLSGNRVDEALDAEGDLTGEHVALFPDVAWRTHFADFVKDAGGWGFSSDFKLGLRLVNPRLPARRGGGPADARLPDPKIWTVELWRMGPPRERLWSASLPEKCAVIHSLEEVGFFEREGGAFVLLAFGGDTAYILSRDDGAFVESFAYGHIETDAEALANKNKFGAFVDDGDPSLRFWTVDMSFNASRGLIACGAFYGRRVRAVSVAAPYETVFEANADDNPWRPRGGVWSVSGVRFAAGKYLVVEYRFAGRGTRLFLQPTEIFETKTWKKVWSENSTDIDSVCISPDGSKMAMIRRGFLEIGPFDVPEKRQGSSDAKRVTGE